LPPAPGRGYRDFLVYWPNEKGLGLMNIETALKEAMTTEGALGVALVG
jgi:hypothetical protein